MTKKRTQYLYKFTGTIQKKYPRKNSEHTQHYYQLKVNLPEYSAPNKLFAFKGKTKLAGSYYLVDWEEVK
ncbi:11453_t:CDS:2, partial [Funneliformis geosporum]